MEILVIALEDFAEQAQRIAGPGADVITARDAVDVIAQPERAAVAYDALLVYLHPSADGQAWVDEQGREVLDVSQVQALPLNGVVVFLGACYGVENAPMIDALFDAGARAVIAGPGENYGGRDGLVGADVLAQVLLRAIGAGLALRASWEMARLAVRVWGLRGGQGVEDALEYELINQSQVEERMGCWQRILAILALLGSLLALLFGGLGDEVAIFDSPLDSPLATSTPAVTYTPWYTADGFLQYDQDFDTPTPCIDCDPTPGARVTYDIFLPLVARNYAATEWSLVVQVDGSTVDRSSAISITASSNITTTNYIIHHGTEATTMTLTMDVISLTLDSYNTGTGSVVTDTDTLTWTLTSFAPDTLAQVTAYYSPVTTTASLTATLNGTEKTATFAD